MNLSLKSIPTHNHENTKDISRRIRRYDSDFQSPSFIA